MEPRKKLARSFCLGLMFALLLVIFNRYPTKLLQELFFTFSQEKDLVVSKIA